jgi:hypothetical protein
MNESESRTENATSEWYVVKQPDGHCEVGTTAPISSTDLESSSEPKHWGPFASQGEAIAKRVGLIRTGKCKPI